MKSARKILKTAKLKTSPPKRLKNSAVRTREYLTQDEVEKLCKSVRKHSFYALRNELIILVMFRHAFRVSELIALRWDQIDLKNGLLHVNRIKNGINSIHPIESLELKLLRRWARSEQESELVFMSERKGSLSTRTIRHIICTAGVQAKFNFPIHPHMLRHSTGYYLANKGIDTRAIQAYLGHANINNTVIYTQLCANRFKNFWE